jgi:hypothetical protein
LLQAIALSFRYNKLIKDWNDERYRFAVYKQLLHSLYCPHEATAQECDATGDAIIDVVGIIKNIQIIKLDNQWKH